MVQNSSHKSDEDDELISPEEADRKGKINIVKGIVNDNEVQSIIKNAVVKQTFTSGLVMAAFFLGLLDLYNTAKTVFNMGWVGDLLVGMALTGMGSIYMVRNLRKASKPNNSKC